MDTLERIAQGIERLAQALETNHREWLAWQQPSSTHNLVSQAEVEQAIRNVPDASPIDVEPPADDHQAVTYTYDDVRQAVMSYQDRHGEKAAKALLKLHGATYIKELKRESYAKLMREAAE